MAEAGRSTEPPFLRIPRRFGVGWELERSRFRAICFVKVTQEVAQRLSFTFVDRQSEAAGKSHQSRSCLSPFGHLDQDPDDKDLRWGVIYYLASDHFVLRQAARRMVRGGCSIPGRNSFLEFNG